MVSTETSEHEEEVLVVDTTGGMGGTETTGATEEQIEAAAKRYWKRQDWLTTFREAATDLVPPGFRIVADTQVLTDPEQEIINAARIYVETWEKTGDDFDPKANQDAQDRLCEAVHNLTIASA